MAAFVAGGHSPLAGLVDLSTLCVAATVFLGAGDLDGSPGSAHQGFTGPTRLLVLRSDDVPGG